jgi:hypothetical protein
MITLLLFRVSLMNIRAHLGDVETLCLSYEPSGRPPSSTGTWSASGAAVSTAGREKP